MAGNEATILIPDISGYTEFMTKTDLLHGTQLINSLINTMVEAVGDEYEVSEIEGDAVLLVRKGAAPSQQQILDICLKIFHAFHSERKFMQHTVICPCGSCQSIVNLTLKFVVHHGPLAELKVGKFIKHSGPEMIVAHRLLKNSINSNEYLLFTDKIIRNTAVSPLDPQLQWFESKDEYSSIGTVNYKFALLEEARKKIPDPPLAHFDFPTSNKPFIEQEIHADYRDTYSILMDIEARSGWVPGLTKVTQEAPHPYIGSEHTLEYDDFEAIVSPLQMNITGEGIVYRERCTIPSKKANLVYEYLFKNIGEKTCIMSARVIPANEDSTSANLCIQLETALEQLIIALKVKCEQQINSFFEPIERCE